MIIVPQFCEGSHRAPGGGRYPLGSTQRLSAHFPTTSWTAPLRCLLAESRLIYEGDSSVAGTRKPRTTVTSILHTASHLLKDPGHCFQIRGLTPTHFLQPRGCPAADALARRLHHQDSPNQAFYLRLASAVCTRHTEACGVHLVMLSPGDSTFSGFPLNWNEARSPPTACAWFGPRLPSRPHLALILTSAFSLLVLPQGLCTCSETQALIPEEPR